MEMTKIMRIDTVGIKVCIDDTAIGGVTEDGVPFPDYNSGNTIITGYYIKDDGGQQALINAVDDGHTHCIKIKFACAGMKFYIKAKVSRVKTYSKDLSFMFTAFLDDIHIII